RNARLSRQNLAASVQTERALASLSDAAAGMHSRLNTNGAIRSRAYMPVLADGVPSRAAAPAALAQVLLPGCTPSPPAVPGDTPSARNAVDEVGSETVPITSTPVACGRSPSPMSCRRTRSDPSFTTSTA